MNNTQILPHVLLLSVTSTLDEFSKLRSPREQSPQNCPHFYSSLSLEVPRIRLTSGLLSTNLGALTTFTLATLLEQHRIQESAVLIITVLKQQKDTN